MGRSTKSKLLIWQWNSRGLISNKSDLQIKIQNSKIKPDILCIQETFLTADSKHIPKINGYSVREFLNRENGQKRGVLSIFVNELLPNTTFGENSHSQKDPKVSSSQNPVEHQSVVITAGSFSFSIFNIYNPGKPQPAVATNYNNL
ncbi:hypothetical protein ACJMK2_041701 [Sinanodonta woodiana]|uniref:Endonuclease/exonuclease/phosphatase domain-containing protein n=1 Tax=Sinanodonta woodiana TaxID=1069815 RepID=A0ABD3W6V2_SINWO